jgi:hypothetical protein
MGEKAEKEDIATMECPHYATSLGTDLGVDSPTTKERLNIGRRRARRLQNRPEHCRNLQPTILYLDPQVM